MQPGDSLSFNKSSPLVPILRQRNLLPHPRISPREIHSNISSGILYLDDRYSNQTFVSTACPAHACYIPRPLSAPWIDCRNNIRWRVRICEALTMQFFFNFLSQLSSSPDSLSVLFRNTYSRKLLAHRSLNVTGDVSELYKTRSKIVVLYFNSTFF
jgi:hypothetical protein